MCLVPFVLSVYFVRIASRISSDGGHDLVAYSSCLRLGVFVLPLLGLPMLFRPGIRTRTYNTYRYQVLVYYFSEYLLLLFFSVRCALLHASGLLAW